MTYEIEWTLGRQGLRKLLVFIFPNPLIKTISFNFHYIPFDLACKLPVEVSNKVKLIRTEGAFQITGSVTRGMISIGSGGALA